MQTIHFNTGRSYTAKGQRITATLHDDGVVTFADHDRGVYGEFKLDTTLAKFEQRDIMHYYDHNLASHTHRAWSDCMMPGGCNSEWKGK